LQVIGRRWPRGQPIALAASFHSMILFSETDSSRSVADRKSVFAESTRCAFPCRGIRVGLGLLGFGIRGKSTPKGCRLVVPLLASGGVVAMQRRTFLGVGMALAAANASPLFAALCGERWDDAAEVLERATVEKQVDAAVLHVVQKGESFTRPFGKAASG